MIEPEVVCLGGIKSLYPDNFFKPGEFAAAAGIDDHERLSSSNLVKHPG